MQDCLTCANMKALVEPWIEGVCEIKGNFCESYGDGSFAGRRFDSERNDFVDCEDYVKEGD